MAELIDCCETHRRAYKKLVHDFAQGRIERGVSEQLYAVLRKASETCVHHPIVDVDADIAAFAL